jgi:predicted PurR-regulated permease PerM
VNAFVYIWRNPYVRVAVYLVIAYVIYLLLGKLESIVRLALLSYLFAYLGNPLVSALERRRVPRWVGTSIVLVIVIVFLGLASVLIGTLASQLVEFSKQLPELVRQFQSTLSVWLAVLEQRPELKDAVAQATQAVQDGLSNILESLLKLVQGQGLVFLSRTVGVISSVLEVFVVFVVGGYMLFSFPSIGKTVLELLPRGWRSLANDLSADVSVAIGGYIRGQLLIAVSIGVMVWAGLSLIGEPLAPTIGFLAGVFNIIPYLGTVIAITPAILLAIPLGFTKVLLVMLVFTVANQIEAHALSPNILSRSTNLSPISIILAILSGLALGGIVGALLAVPLVALANLLIKKYWIGSRPHGGLDAPPEPVHEELNV